MKNKWVYIAASGVLGFLFIIHHLSILIFLISLLILLYITFRDRKVGIICMVTLVLFSAIFYLHDQKNETKLSINHTYFTGKFISTPKINGDRFTSLFLLSNKEKLYVSYRIKSEHEKEILAAISDRTTCRFYGELKAPNPTRNFYSFDFKQYLYRKNIHWIVTPTTLSTLQCIKTKPSILDRLYLFREHTLKEIETLLPSPLDGFVQALVFGGRANVDEDVLTAYQELGLIHLLAISGMHVGLICAALFYMLVRIGFTKEKVIMIIMILLPLYGLLAGAAPSVIRACIMSFLVLLKVRFRSFPLTTVDLISIAFLIMVILNPYYIFDVGFQLSFSVSLALILSSQTILLKVTNPIVQLFMVSTISQISSIPLILYHFYQFSLVSVPLNLIYVPIITFILLPICIFFYFTLSFSVPLLSTLIVKSNEMLHLLNSFAVMMTEQKWHILVFGKPNILLLWLYILAVILTFIWLEKEIKWISFMPIFLVLVIHYFLPYINPQGEISMIDVGQGDSILIEIPFRKEVYLIDTGGTVPYDLEKWQQRSNPFSIGKDTILPYLKAKGIRKINKLILTHPDLDHIGEASYLLKNIEIDEIVTGAYHSSEGLEAEVLNLASKLNVKVRRVKAGDHWKAGDLSFKILAPSTSYSKKNDGSIVLTAFLDGKSWLFTGDIEEEAEEDLLERYPNLKIDVLKVSHHGSLTSTSSHFLNTVRPRVALISAGLNNRFGHPHPDVLSRLKTYDTVIFRTDQHGGIRYKFSSFKSGTFYTKLP
ncbi:DNA internalization-related competence protein ComEC/Rec2 [Bacillus sp. AK128]